MQDEKATVFIVDDEESIRASLSLLMESVNQNVETFASAQKFLETMTEDTSGVAVLDIRMPEMSGMVLQSRLREINPSIPIIFITGYADVSIAVQAMRNGAFDFVQKPFQNQVLIDSIQDALAAGSHARLCEQKRELTRERLARLTTRERQVLDLIIEGKPNKVIAAELSLSQRTVEVHRASVMKKMEVDSVATLVRMVMVVNEDSPPQGRSIPHGVHRSYESAMGHQGAA